jgi:hypothetical protein
MDMSYHSMLLLNLENPNYIIMISIKPGSSFLEAAEGFQRLGEAE